MWHVTRVTSKGIVVWIQRTEDPLPADLDYPLTASLDDTLSTHKHHWTVYMSKPITGKLKARVLNARYGTVGSRSGHLLRLFAPWRRPSGKCTLINGNTLERWISPSWERIIAYVLGAGDSAPGLDSEPYEVYQFGARFVSCLLGQALIAAQYDTQLLREVLGPSIDLLIWILKTP